MQYETFKKMLKKVRRAQKEIETMPLSKSEDFQRIRMSVIAKLDFFEDWIYRAKTSSEEG